MTEETDAWLAEQTARYMEAEDKEHAEVFAHAKEAARNPPTEGEQMHALGEAECLCHCSPPCRLHAVLTEWEADMAARIDVTWLFAFWEDVGDCRELMKTPKEIN